MVASIWERVQCILGIEVKVKVKVKEKAKVKEEGLSLVCC